MHFFMHKVHFSEQAFSIEPNRRQLNAFDVAIKTKFYFIFLIKPKANRSLVLQLTGKISVSMQIRLILDTTPQNENWFCSYIQVSNIALIITVFVLINKLINSHHLKHEIGTRYIYNDKGRKCKRDKMYPTNESKRKKGKNLTNQIKVVEPTFRFSFQLATSTHFVIIQHQQQEKKYITKPII